MRAHRRESSFACVGEIDNTVPAGESKVYGFLWSPVFSENVPIQVRLE